MSLEKSSFRKGFGQKIAFILGYPLVLDCLFTKTCVSLGLIVLKTFPLCFPLGKEMVLMWDLGGLGY